jgi:hypothetical protein
MSKQPRQTKPQPNVLHEASVRRMLATPPQAKKKPVKKAGSKKKR